MEALPPDSHIITAYILSAVSVYGYFARASPIHERYWLSVVASGAALGLAAGAGVAGFAAGAGAAGAGGFVAHADSASETPAQNATRRGIRLVA